jgi:hypothetical protein
MQPGKVTLQSPRTYAALKYTSDRFIAIHSLVVKFEIWLFKVIPIIVLN